MKSMPGGGDCCSGELGLSENGHLAPPNPDLYVSTPKYKDNNCQR